MHLIVIGWAYVALMMAVAEATHDKGSVIGAIITFFLYGVAPIALVVYLMGHGARRRGREARAAAVAATSPNAPDAGGEATTDPITPVRKEP